MEYKGLASCEKIAIGKIFIQNRKSKAKHFPFALSDLDSSAQLLRWQTAREQLDAQLSRFYDETSASLGASEAAVFESHRLILNDPEFTESVTALISEKQFSAEAAVTMTCSKWKDKFEDLDNLYFCARMEDIEDISRQLIVLLSNADCTIRAPKEPVIYAAETLTPSELLRLDRDKLLGIVLAFGSPLSHTAILAKAMHVPVLLGVDTTYDMDGKLGILDGSAGVFITDPSDEMLEIYRAKQMQTAPKETCPSLPDGQQASSANIRVYANLNHLSELSAALRAGADGIGLFRTEFLFLASDDFPSEEEQFEAYRTAAEGMGGKKIIIRTMDIGADKQADYFHPDHEDNPAMGYRAIRIGLDRTDLLITQLRAILRAACFGDIAIMFPMITSVSEVKKLKSIASLAKEQLSNEGIPFANPEFGIMIETPAAVMISDELAKEVDFFSIGTNDLTQFTLAMDRMNAKLSKFYDAHHPAILRMIEMTVRNAHQSGCKVGICGELAADLSLTKMFLEMKMDELSVSPSMITELRNQIQSIDPIS